MKVEKFKVLLYLKKSEPDKTGKAPIMGRITLNRTMAQFSCKLSCTPGLWNARESRLNGKSREAVETNEKIERLLLAVHSAFNSLMERKRDFDAAAVRDMFQGNAGMQMTLLKLLDRHNGEMKARVGVDRAPTTLSTYLFTYRTLSEFIKAKFKVPDLVFGQLNEQFIRDYQDFILLEKGYAVDTLRGYLAILKRSAASPTRRATRRNTISATSSCPSRRRQHRKHSAVRISRSCVIWRYRKNAGHILSPKTSSSSPVTPAPPTRMR